MAFGESLRDLRTQRGLGIKRLAPELGVSYSYLSKLEANLTRPSEDLIRRVATYFGQDEDPLFVAADRIPPDLLLILKEHPDAAAKYLRERFRRGRGSA